MYHIMNTNDIKLFNEIASAHRAELEALQEKVLIYSYETGYKRDTNWSEYVQASKPIQAVEKREMTEFMADKIAIHASKKTDAIVEACRTADSLGLTSFHLVKVSRDVKSTLRYWLTANWFVYKEAGVWFYKLKEECQTANPVSF